MGFVLLLGGARSGKSALAVRLAHESNLPVTVIATATAGDEEMVDRIRRHREARPSAWKTVEEPIDVLGALRSSAASDFVVVDCLTLWVTNLLGAGHDPADFDRLADPIVRELGGRRGVVVTNEVGMGIVPANELARQFRDVLGFVNTRFAEGAERAVLMVAGRAVELERT
jgi:adenosyl cobinamide kinase/adenosyl cobinamide phosphate guanylyltransferase